MTYPPSNSDQPPTVPEPRDESSPQFDQTWYSTNEPPTTIAPVPITPAPEAYPANPAYGQASVYPGSAAAAIPAQPVDPFAGAGYQPDAYPLTTPYPAPPPAVYPPGQASYAAPQVYPPVSAQPYSGQPYSGQPYPGQPYPVLPYPGQPFVVPNAVQVVVGAPFGVDPVTGQPLSDKSKIVAGLLQLLLAVLFSLGGIGRLYAGNTTVGVLQLVASFFAWTAFWCGVFGNIFVLFLPFFVWFGLWLWFVIDGIVLLAGRPVDGQGRLLRS